MATEWHQLLLPFPDERPPLKEACSRLCKQLGYPRWLSSVGIRDSDLCKDIIIYLRTEHHPELPKEWEGYPVSTRFFGEFATMGRVDD